MKHFCALLVLSLTCVPALAVAQDVTDVLATVNCPYPIPTPRSLPSAGTGERLAIALSQPTQGIGSSPILWVPVMTTVTRMRAGFNDVQVTVGQVNSVGSTTSNNMNDGINHLERLFLPNHAVPVYPASTVDCLVRALSTALTEERRATVEQRAIIEGLVTRLERSETDLRKVIADNKVEQDARFEHIESLIKAGN